MVFLGFQWAKMAQTGPEMTSLHLSEHPNRSGIAFGKTRFSPIFDPLLVPKRPLLRAFWDFPWAKMLSNGLKLG